MKIEDFDELVSMSCYLCGHNDTLNGVDRVDNDIGYEIDNCEPCCATCNQMKRDINLGDFLSTVQEVT